MDVYIRIKRVEAGQILLHVLGTAEYVATALDSLPHFVPLKNIHLNKQGLLRVDVKAAKFFVAWLHAVEATHLSKVIWLPIGADV